MKNVHPKISHNPTKSATASSCGHFLPWLMHSTLTADVGCERCLQPVELMKSLNPKP